MSHKTSSLTPYHAAPTLQDAQRCPQNTKEWQQHVEARERAGLDTTCYSQNKVVPSTPMTWELPETLPDETGGNLAKTLFTSPAAQAPPKPSVGPSRRLKLPKPSSSPSVATLAPSAPAPVPNTDAKAPAKPPLPVPDTSANPAKRPLPDPDTSAKAPAKRPPPVPDTSAQAPQKPGKGTGNPVTTTAAEETEEDYANAPEPPAEPSDLSDGAIRKRIYRMVAPREDGSYLLPESVIREYKDPNTRHQIVREFEKCGWSPAPHLQD